MKKYIYIALLSVGLLSSITSCKKSFLEKEPTSLMTDARLKKLNENPVLAKQNAAGQVAGMYKWMYTWKTGGTDGDHIDFGQKANDLLMDFSSGDMVTMASTNYNWYRNIQNYQFLKDPNQNVHYMIWRYYYRVIFEANNLLAVLPEVKADTDREIVHFVGQAKVMRAYAYFYLTQFLATKYLPEVKLLPLYTDPNQVNLPKSTEKEIFAQIIKDASEGAEYLKDFNRKAIHEVTADIANAILAYTYGFMQDWTNMEKYSKLVVDNKAYSPMTAQEIVFAMNDKGEQIGGTGFVSPSKGWMWGTQFTEDMDGYLMTFWGQVDIFFYSYATVQGGAKCMDDVLFNKIRQDDVRKGQFINFNEFSINMPVNKFFQKKRDMGFPKNFIAGARQFVGTQHYMRVAEMYLLHAEALARLNKDAEAKTELKAFLTDRIKDLSYIDNLGHEDLVKEIELQTRIEFFGEGRSYLLMKRGRTTIERGTLGFDKVNSGAKIPYDDARLTYQIPQNEVINNPNLNK